MYFSIAPTEITAQMSRQFPTTPSVNSDAFRVPAARHQSVMRHRISVALHGLATRLEPTATAA